MKERIGDYDWYNARIRDHEWLPAMQLAVKEELLSAACVERKQLAAFALCREECQMLRLLNREVLTRLASLRESWPEEATAEQ